VQEAHALRSRPRLTHEEARREAVAGISTSSLQSSHTRVKEVHALCPELRLASEGCSTRNGRQQLQLLLPELVHGFNLS
jgi:hypothetical protein